MTTGASRPLASPRVGSVPGPPASTLPLLTLAASPLAAISGPPSGPILTPWISTRCAVSLPLRLFSVPPSLLAPVSMPNPTPPLKVPLGQKLRPVAFTLMPAVPPAQVPDSRPLRPADTHVPAPLFRVALQRRLRMPIWDCDTACGLCGEVLTGSFVTMSSATPSARLSPSSPPSPPSLRSLVSCSLPGPLTPVVPALTPTFHPNTTPPLAAAAAPRTSGFPGSLWPHRGLGLLGLVPPFHLSPLLRLPLRGWCLPRSQIPQEFLPEHHLTGGRLGCHFPPAGPGGLRGRVVSCPA